MPQNKKFGVEVIVSAVDEASSKFKDIYKKINSSGLAKLNNSFRLFAGASGLKNVGKAAANVGRAASHAASEIGALATKIGAFVGVGGGGLFLLTKDFADFADKVKDGSLRLGASTDAFQTWSIGASLAGVDSDVFALSLDRLSKNFGQAKLQGLGFNTIFGKLFTQNQLKGFKSFEQLLPAVIRKLNSYQDIAKRNAIGTAIFGKSFGKLIPYLKEYDKFNRQAKDFILSKEEIERGDEFKDQLKSFVNLMGLLKNIAGGAMLEGFSAVMADLQKFLMDNRQNIKDFFTAIGKELPGAFARLAAVIKMVFGYFATFDEKTKTITWNTGRMKAAFLLFAAILTGPALIALASVVGSLVTLGIALGSALGAIMIFFTGAETAMGALAIIFGAITLPIWGWVAVFAAVAAAIWYFWEPIKNLFSEIWDIIKLVGGVMGSLFGFGGGVSSAPASAPVNVQSFLAPQNSTQTNNASVSIDLQGLPRGSRVTTQSDRGLDFLLTRGLTMSGGG